MVWTRTFFFFQAEDGIRDLTVTGVQTCALPISRRRSTRMPRRSTGPSTTTSFRQSTRRGRVGAPRRQAPLLLRRVAYLLDGLERTSAPREAAPSTPPLAMALSWSTEPAPASGARPIHSLM